MPLWIRYALRIGRITDEEVTAMRMGSDYARLSAPALLAFVAITSSAFADLSFYPLTEDTDRSNNDPDWLPDGPPGV